MKKRLYSKTVAIITVLALMLSVIHVPFVVLANDKTGTETIVAEVVNRDGVSAVDSAKTNYFNRYRVTSKSTSFVSYGHISSVIKIGGNGVSAKNSTQTFLFDLNDATVSFTPYIATFTYKAKLSVYGSKDGEIWLPLVLNEEPGNYARKGNNAQWNPDSDTTELGALTDWSNYNTANMNVLLSDNAEKIIYLKFNYVGDGTDATQAEAKAFGVTASYDKDAQIKSADGTEHYLSSAWNRSDEGSYWNNEAPENDATKETYFQKYMVVEQSKYRGNSYVAEIRKDQTGNQLVFKYDLNDSTTSFIPTVWVNTKTDANIKIEASKDGNKWYTIVNEDVLGGGVANGVVYGDIENAAYIDSYASNSGIVKEWKTLNTQNVAMILSGNKEKTVYLRFSRGEAPASGYAAEDHEYRGFGLTGIWDSNAAEQPLCDTETFVGEVQNRNGLSSYDETKSNYFNKYLVSEQSTKFVSITGADWLLKMGGAYTNGLNGSYVFKYDLNNSTINFTPYIATGTYNAKINVYASKDARSWLPLIIEESPASNAYIGDVNTFQPNADVERKGALTAWSNYNYENVLKVLSGNPTKTVYIRYDYIGTGDDEAQIQAFGISSMWSNEADEISATSGVQNIISNTENRDNYGTTNPNSPNYFQKYLVKSQSKYHPLSFLVKLYIPSHQVVFKYDLHDSTVSFTPYLWASGECNAKINIEASADGKNWVTVVKSEQVVNGHYGDIVNTSHKFATAQSSAVQGWKNYDSAAAASVLKNNKEKTVYLRYTYAGIYDAKGIATTECQLQGFGITGIWNEEKYETFVGEVQNRDDISGCGSYHTDEMGRKKQNYFNKYLVEDKSSYTALNESLIKIGGKYAQNGYLTFKYDLNDETTAFYPYMFTNGEYTAKINVLASKDGKSWLSLVDSEAVSKGDFLGNITSFKPHKDVVNKGTIKNWKNYNIGNMRLVLSDNSQKTVYLKFVYNGTGDDEAQISAVGISCLYDSVIDADPSVATGSTNVVIREEIIASTDNRDGYEGTNPDADNYFNRYLVKEKSSYKDLYYLAKLIKGDKVVVKFDLRDKTTSFIPWLEMGGDKYSVVKVSGSKDGENWLELVNKSAADPGVSYGKDVAWKNFNTKNMNAILKGNSKKIVYLCFEFVSGAYNPITKQMDEESQCQGFGIIGEHNAKALSASVTSIAKTEYAINDEELDITDGIITVKYNTGEKIDYPFSQADVRGFKAGIPGKQTIYVEKHGIVASYGITVDSMPIREVKITKLPDILEFEVGEQLSTKGGKVMVTFEDGTTDERALVTSMVVGYDSSKITKKLTLKVIVGYASTEYDISVIEKTVIVSESIRIDATPFVSHDGLFEMLLPDDQAEDHKRLLEQRKQNNCEDDLNLGEMITDSSLTLTSPTNSAGVVMNVFGGGHFVFEMDLNDRAVDFELTRGWGTYNDMKILASKDNGKTWYLIGRVLDQVSGMNTVFTSSDLSQEQIDKNIEWILTGNPEKKFLIKYVCDAYGNVEGNIQISNIMMNVYYVTGPRFHKDLPKTVPAGYKIPTAYTFGMLPSEQNIEESGDYVTEPDDTVTDNYEEYEEPTEEQKAPQVIKKTVVDKEALIRYIILVSLCGVAIIASWAEILFMYLKLRKKRKI